MGVKVRERKPGEWWVFVNHKGRRKAKEVGSREAAEAADVKIGGPLADDTINGIHDRCRRKAKLRLTRVHDARHCFASWNLSAGASLFWVSRQMGHSSSKVTADLNGKYIPTEDRTAANLLDCIKIRNLSATSGQEAEAAER